ncbi:triple gene block protein 1 [Vanilla latent virus]|uniref:Triple gene block protein 1 n=1 Tax=Vanilla latent virus TaxID=2016426 RepID=A0A220NQ49_9VIRU|nr:triple gene block protein 1 [Vanilla latent virus]ASJ78778.1 triple gene block protein 1 [Vanilla latent virus]
MKILELEALLLTAGFIRTNLPLQSPITIHGVPGSGKSTIIKKLIQRQDVIAYTLGAPYGKDLSQPGVLPYTEATPKTTKFVILDEYQLDLNITTEGISAIFGDPYQGNTDRPAHYISIISHRVPKPVTDFLTTLDFEIQSFKPGTLTTVHPYKATQFQITPEIPVIHIAEISQALLSSHSVHSHSPQEVSGLEFDVVVVVFHSSELRHRSRLYIACTRAKRHLHLISDKFDEFCTTS